MKRGKCELCHAVADLHDSHYLPKSGYKRMRASDLKNPNPVLLAGGKAQQSSLQVRDYKFCSACEERFNKGGEAWILSKIPPNYGDPFWLHTLLDSKTPIMSGNDLLWSRCLTFLCRCRAAEFGSASATMAPVRHRDRACDSASDSPTSNHA